MWRFEAICQRKNTENNESISPLVTRFLSILPIAEVVITEKNVQIDLLFFNHTVGKFFFLAYKSKRVLKTVTKNVVHYTETNFFSLRLDLMNAYGRSL